MQVALEFNQETQGPEILEKEKTSYQEEVKLDPTLCVGDFVFPLAHLFGLKHRVPHPRGIVFDSPQVGELFNFQGRCSIDEVWNVKILDIVTCDDIWIYLPHKV